ncbi:MAG: IS630 family transposase [Planctomycetota bacterium]|nr:IS630 family transposase [Planctomycetota bacterium]MCZ7606498.1 IS630 family transposase [Planctomycetota bacterium]MCZ7607019.1 IS630 family transposase [Planctomycetota bacterium]MCZ7607484.1 IS630 family transposase [Planctomycetota bacterium]MCZ7607561.1 IS630 family transposase [Planctomycetota bacterium]
MLLALACTPPSDHGLPHTHWTVRLLAFMAFSLALLPSISHETVRVWLEAAEIKPHHSRYWLHSQDPDFDAKMQDVVGLYLHPPKNSVVLCFDEKTCIQALERRHPDWPMRPGSPQRREFEYIRHGTQDLFASLNPHTGEVWAECRDRHKGEDVAEHLAWLIKQQPRRKKIHLVRDNLSAHNTDAVKKVIARHRGRVQVHATPTHASWLNMVELFFAEVSRNVIRRGNFASVPDLQQKLLAWVEWHNENAKPYKWTYTGQPLTK